MSSRPIDRLALEVRINGLVMFDLLDTSITSTNCYAADTYSLTFSIGSDVSSNMTFWSSLQSGYVEVLAQSSACPAPKILISGLIDTLQIDPIRHIAVIQGRDLSSLLVDAYRQQDFVNQTASEIVEAVAHYHNLQPIVTQTSAIVGRYYSDGFTKLSLGQFSRLQSDWDLLVLLARESAFDIFVKEKSLYFQPAFTSDPAIPLSMGDVERFYVNKDLTISHGSSVCVQSWNSQSSISFKNSVKMASSLDSSVSASHASAFLFSAPNQTSEDVADLANQYSNELSRLRTVLHLQGPWDLNLAPRTILSVNQTYSSFDTTYRIESIERHYNSTSGSRQKVEATQL